MTVINSRMDVLYQIQEWDVLVYQIHVEIGNYKIIVNLDCVYGGTIHVLIRLVLLLKLQIVVVMGQ